MALTRDKNVADPAVAKATSATKKAVKKKASVPTPPIKKNTSVPSAPAKAVALKTNAHLYEKCEFGAMQFRQRGIAGPNLVLFFAQVGQILEWASVAELGPASRGPQREQKEARVQAIKKFLEVDKGNIIPTAVVLAFSVGKATFQVSGSQGGGTLKIPAGNNHAATIVDGQHRLYGMYQYDPKIEVPVIALLEADEVERAFQFLIINNKSSKVATTHTKALLAKLQNTSLVSRLKSAKLAFDVEGIKDVDIVNSDKESPFFESVDWTTTPLKNRMIPASAIELSLDYLGGLGILEFDDRDTRRSVFLVMWKAIKSEWNSLWVKEGRLVSKVGIFCLTRFIVDRISAWADSDDLEIELSDLGEIEKLTKKILAHMDKRFWTTPWAESSMGGFDTNQGRDRVLAAITTLFRNGRRDAPWYSDIDIIERSAAENV